MSTCNWLDSQTLGSQPVMSKNLLDHCSQPLDGYETHVNMDLECAACRGHKYVQ